MKTSEHLMLGSTLLKPLCGRFINDEGTEGCAMGMILAAKYGLAAVLQMDKEDAVPADWNQIWYNRPTFTALPCNCRDSMVMGSAGASWLRSWCEISPCNVIVHMFNYHVCTNKDWTIEQLADWIATIEPQEEVPTINLQGAEKEVVDSLKTSLVK
jgi:hypothetical protein